MGGWKLEVFRMTIYMSFPVALFYYFNQPEYFEDWVKKTRREIYPPETAAHRQQFEDAIKEVQKRSAEELLAAMEAHENKLK